MLSLLYSHHDLLYDSTTLTESLAISLTLTTATNKLLAVSHCQYITESLARTLIQGHYLNYRGADKYLARPGRKQATATEDFDVHISYL